MHPTLKPTHYHRTHAPTLSPTVYEYEYEYEFEYENEYENDKVVVGNVSVVPAVAGG